MKLGVLKEPDGETRVAIVPTSSRSSKKRVLKLLLKPVQELQLNYHDAEYEAAGATVGTRDDAGV